MTADPYVKDNLASDVGFQDLVTLHSYRLTNHPLVVMVDPSTMFLQPIDEVKMVMINLSLAEAQDPQKQRNLKSILEEHSGDRQKLRVPTVVCIDGEGDRHFIRLGQNFWVQNPDQVINALAHAQFRARLTPVIPQ